MTSYRSELLNISRISINRDSRQRRELKIDEGFKDSIRRNGVLNPIVVHYDLPTDTNLLIAGERRLETCKQLDVEGVERKDPKGKIPVRFTYNMSRTELKIIELEENIKRLDLPWQDIVRSVGEIHSLYRAQTPGWQVTQTADAVSLTKPTISEYLTIYEFLSDPRVSASGTVREAYNLLLRRKSRSEADAMEELLYESREGQTLLEKVVGVDPVEAIIAPDSQLIEKEERADWAPTSSVLQTDFLSWATGYEGKRFSLIHCDFPFGVGLFSSNGLRSGEKRSQMGRDVGEDYDDSRETYRALLESLCANLPRLLSASGHIMFWLDSRPETIEFTRLYFQQNAPGVKWARFPLIWLKSDNAGIAAVPQFEPRHVYETCLLGRQGDRPLIRVKSDAYSAPTDKTLHPSCKPEAMLRHFMEMLVDEDSAVLDPTCGSGSALRAAESLGAQHVLGLERDEGFARSALGALNAARAKKKAAEAIGL